MYPFYEKAKTKTNKMGGGGVVMNCELRKIIHQRYATRNLKMYY
jgi:hypothetical protein